MSGAPPNRNATFPRGLSRRDLLRLAIRLGLASPTAALLAACRLTGDSDNDPTGTPDTAANPTSTDLPAPTPTSTVLPSATATTNEVPSATSVIPTPTPTPTALPRAADHLTIVTPLKVQSQIPHWKIPALWSAARITQEPLFDFDSNLQPILHLATEWPTVENGLLDPDGRWIIWKTSAGTSSGTTARSSMPRTPPSPGNILSNLRKQHYQHALLVSISRFSTRLSSQWRFIDSHAVQGPFSAAFSPAWFSPSSMAITV